MNFNFSMGQIIVGTIFSSIGFVAFVYGKKTESYKAMGLGAALMLYPIFVQETVMMAVVGTALTAALYFFRD